jgi:hypothetical protein
MKGIYFVVIRLHLEMTISLQSQYSLCWLCSLILSPVLISVTGVRRTELSFQAVKQWHSTLLLINIHHMFSVASPKFS